MLEYLAAPDEQLRDQRLARHPEGLGGAVEVHAVAALVLHLGDEHGLAAQRRRARDPVALGQHADDLRMRVLGDLPDQGLPVGLRHPVLRLDLLLRIDARLEARGAASGIALRRNRLAALAVQPLGVHGNRSGCCPDVTQD